MLKSTVNSVNRLLWNDNLKAWSKNIKCLPHFKSGW